MECVSNDKDKDFQPQSPEKVRRKTCDFWNLWCVVKSKGTFRENTTSYFSKRAVLRNNRTGGRGKAALRRRVDTWVITRSRITRTQQVLDFYVHPSPCSSICWFTRWYRWRKSRFFASPGEGNCLIAFTLIVLNISGFCGWGEEVKAKNEKSRTRA